MKVGLFKLCTGEEILGKIVDETPDSVTLDDIRVIMLAPVSPTQMGVQLIPWLAGAPDVRNVTISTKDIVFSTTNVPAQLEQGYLENTTGIELAHDLKL